MTNEKVGQVEAPSRASTNRITAVLTSHNRAEVTVRCLDLLKVSAEHAGVELRAILVDDGSTDGTSSIVRSRFEWVRIISADGSLFWNRGMHLGMKEALFEDGCDFILWINDDTDLLVIAIERLLKTERALRVTLRRPAIVVGATADRATGQLTYGGNVAVSRWRPFTYRKVFSESTAQPCETMNGNVVLLPLEIAKAVGNLDPYFEHAMGDIDYGLRATRKGYPVYVAPGYVGSCNHNPPPLGDGESSLAKRWRQLVSRKGLPPRSWLHLTRRHGGLLWPIYFAMPYLRILRRRK